MKSFASFLAVAVLGLPFAAQAGTIVNVNASSSGTAVSLAAGTYTLSVIGTQQGGTYGGWGLDSTSCSKTTTNWSEEFDMSLGHSSTTFDLAGNPTFSSASSALSAYEFGLLQQNGHSPASTVDNSATFTVTPGESVEFEIPAASRCGMKGGVSLLIDPAASAATAPEPSSLGLMGLVLVGGATAFRRRFNRQS